MASLGDIALSIASEQELDTAPNFEGPEKVLEIWFVPPSEYEDDNCECASTDLVSTTNNGSNNRRYLLSVQKEAWVEMLDLVKCQILR